MLNKYKQIRAKFSSQYQAIRDEIDSVFVSFDADPSKPLTLMGKKFFVVTEENTNPHLEAFVKFSPIGLAKITNDLPPEEVKMYLESLGVELNEVFFYTQAQVMRTVKHRAQSKFLLAHEIGHYLLNHMGLSVEKIKPCASHQIEYEADFFATEIVGNVIRRILLDTSLRAAKISNKDMTMSKETKEFVFLGLWQQRNRIFNISQNFSWR